MSTNAGFTGAAPKVVVTNVRPSEKEIYERMWKTEQYRAVAPGEDCAQEFLRVVRPKKGAEVVDLGCGTGRGALALALFGGLNVTMVDFAANCLDADIVPALETQKHALRFVEADLTKRLPMTAEYGYCTDVMEHIPPEDVDKVLNNCLMACQHVFFVISTVDDVCGQLIGHPLHLTVQPYAWWLKKLQDRDCVVHWSEDRGDHCLFYVTAWQAGKAVVEVGVLNATVEQVKANVRQNVKGPWQQIRPHQTNDVEIMIAGGGPTLSLFEAEIRARREGGMPLVTLNGAYNWAVEKGLRPSATVIVDARPHNARFTKPVVAGCKYFIASQCDPAVLEGLPPERTWLWHTTTEMIREELAEAYEAWWGIPGGSTVLLRAIPMLRMLGFKTFHLYGCDSCIMDGSHHAFLQPENDRDGEIPVLAGPEGAKKKFLCHPWMFAQAQEFMDLIKVLGNEMQIAVYGDGLLAHIIQSGADIEEASDLK